MESKFDPKRFGFDDSACKSSLGQKPIGKCYVHIGSNGKAQICIDCATAENVRELCGGDRCDFAIDKKCRIAIYPGRSRKVSQSTKGSRRYSIAASGITEQVLATFGRFQRMYVEPSSYAGGTAILLTPTEQFDRE